MCRQLGLAGRLSRVTTLLLLGRAAGASRARSP
jgi:hypothetical protein